MNGKRKKKKRMAEIAEDISSHTHITRMIIAKDGNAQQINRIKCCELWK